MITAEMIRNEIVHMIRIYFANLPNFPNIMILKFIEYFIASQVW